MKFAKKFKFAISIVRYSKLRSWLTIIGIVIGVASVLVIVSIGEGLEKSLNKQFSGIGADIVTISPGFKRSSSNLGDVENQNLIADLDRKDVIALKAITDVEYVDTNILGSVNAYYQGSAGEVIIKGVAQSVWPKLTQEKVEKGRLLDSADQNVILLGNNIANDFFKNKVSINKPVVLNGKSYRVVGILKKGGMHDDQIIIPLSSAYQLMDYKKKDVYDMITLRIKDGKDIDKAVEKIQQRLDIIRHVTEDERDYSVLSTKQLMDQIKDVSKSVTMFLGAIAAVALVVGSVGIANTMFTSVLEKIKDIGVMKAIGATNLEILEIFLFNSAIIGLVGGFFGVCLGLLISKAIPFILPRASDGSLVSTSISLNLILGILLFSILIGMVSGAIPAFNASRLKPVDSLRY